MEGSKLTAKPFVVRKRLVFEAWEKVRANRGASGVDAETIERFAAREADNLYKLWNRMSSGSYMPAPVRAVEIPKGKGSVRLLGVPTVTDRVAQTAVAQLLEERVDALFHADSYGYRPGRSALDAVAVTRRRCWKYDWVIDLDIRAFFDSVPHELLMKAVAHHVQERWVLLYIERWLTAPMQMPDGMIVARERGTPQGSPISPILANLFMHYAFDRWMTRTHAGCPFARYADDVVVHCTTRSQADRTLRAIIERMAELGLEVHPAKTKIVYCKDSSRTLNSQHTSFDFLGFCFRGRKAKGRRGYFVNFLPAMSPAAKKSIGTTIRGWQIKRRTAWELSDLVERINPSARGWINYYGAYYRSELHFLARRLDLYLMGWAKRKYKRIGRSNVRAARWLASIKKRDPALFAHWNLRT
jgi:group II intron reverse transcriptase/maturase